MSSVFFTRPVLVLLAGAAALLLTACSKPAPPPEAVRAVRVLTMGLGTTQVSPEYAGEVRARIESRLGFRVPGKITRRLIEAGQPVRSGQPLAELDAQDYQLAVQAAQAQVAAASTNRDLAQADYQRYKELKEQNFISGAELERRDSTLKAAQAQLAQAQAQLANQKNQSSYTLLKADVAGVVTAVEAEPGQVVSAGTVVVRIAQDGPRDVVFAVPEDAVAGFASGLPMEVRWNGRAALLKGLVREVSASADPVTRTFTVKLALHKGDAPPLGVTVAVLPAAQARLAQQALKLPTSALRQEGGHSAVWVLEPSSMTLKSQAVQLGAPDGNEALVVSGLQPGMLVVTAGVHVLSAGEKVSIYREKAPTANSAVNHAVDSATVIPAK